MHILDEKCLFLVEYCFFFVLMNFFNVYKALGGRVLLFKL